MAKHIPLPSQEYLRELYDYDAETGQLIRKTYRNSQTVIGEVCGHIKSDGYRDVVIDSRQYYASRIIWMWVTGDDPGELYVDHINRDRDNNRWSNLRLADRPQQMWNRRLPGKGYSFDKQRGQWAVRFYVRGKRIFGGRFADESDAAAAAVSLRAQYQGEFQSTFVSA
jgi:hypothetical protein